MHYTETNNPEEKLYFLLHHKNINPNIPAYYGIYDYSQTKTKIRKELKLKLKTYQIHILAHELYLYCSKYCFSHKLHHSNINAAFALDLISEDEYSNKFYEFTCRIAKIKLDDAAMKSLAKILIESSILINDFFRDKPESNKYNQFLMQYDSLKTKIGLIFNHELTTDEFHLLAESWCYYASLAQDISFPNNWFKEIVKEEIHLINSEIESIQNRLDIQNNYKKAWKPFNRFIDTGIIRRDQTCDLETELSLLMQAKSNLSMKKGSTLNHDNMMNWAYYSVLFCAEILGLSYTSKKNGFLDFLIALEGLDCYEQVSQKQYDPHFEEKEKARNHASKTYNNYLKMKETPQYKEQINILLSQAKHESDSITNLDKIMNNFRKMFIPIKILNTDRDSTPLDTQPF